MRLRVASLVPFVSGLALAACGNDAAGGTEDSLTGGDPSASTDPSASGPAGQTTLPGGPTTVAPTPNVTMPPGPTGPSGPGAVTPVPVNGPTGGAGGTQMLPTGGTANVGSGGMSVTPSGSGGTTPSATGGTGVVAGGAGGTTSAPVGGGGGGGAASGGSGEVTPVVDGVNVQLDKTRQNIQGFGFNTALMPGGSLPYDDLFGLDGPNAIGLSILRVGMNSNGTLTGQGIDEARGMGAKIIGSCWSPPANCKTNNSTQNGGNLKTSCYESWSDTIVNFAKQYDLYAMSIANESDFASCPGNPVCTDAYDTTVYTANMMVDWVKVAGKKLKDAGIKVIAPEASEWIHAWSNASGTGSIVSTHPDSSDPLGCGCFSNSPTEEGCAQKCLDGDGYDYGHHLWADQDAWGSFDIFGVHEYDSQIAFPWPADVNDGVRDKEVWQTEMSGVMHWPEQGPSTDIDNGIAVAGWIHSALTVGEASAWLYWWYQAYYQDDNEGLALTKNGNTIAKRYFTLGNYSKFVRPGFFAVEVAGNDNADVLLSAYVGDAGQVVVVAINKGGAAVDIPITITGGTAPASMTPNVTSASASLMAGTAVPVTDGVFTASLAAKSVTSFVGE